MLFIRISLLTVSLGFILSCSKTCYCKTATLNLDYISFDPAKLDTVIMRRYSKGNNFSGILNADTLTVANAVFKVNKDTISIHPNNVASNVSSYFDYIFYLPSLNRRDSLTDIYESRDTEKGGHDLECNCINRVYSYYLNLDTVKITD